MHRWLCVEPWMQICFWAIKQLEVGLGRFKVMVLSTNIGMPFLQWL